MFRGEECSGVTVLDAVAVVEGGGGTEGPARTARRLVADVSSNGGALRPVGADIERLRDRALHDLPHVCVYKRFRVRLVN